MRIHSFVAPAILLAAVAFPAAADDWNKTYTVTGKPEVRLESNDGHIEVRSWDKSQVQARVVTEGWRIGPNDVRITERQSGDRVEVLVHVPSMHWSFGINHRSVRIEVSVPRESNLMAKTGDGHVEVRALTGSLEVSTGDGHITLFDVRGQIRLHTGDGHIDAEDLDGRLDATTGDGHIRVRGRFDELRLRTNDGSINAETRPNSQVSPEWTLDTGDGSITLRLPRDLKADLDAHTGDGRITLDVPVTVNGKLSKTEVRGKLNGGGSLLRIHTGDGSIRIEGL